MAGEKPNANSDYADHISLVINSGSWAFTRDGLFDLLAKSRGLSDESIPGFIGTGKGSARWYYLVYKALDYLTPDGNKLVVECHNDLSEKFDICEYGYEIGTDIAISTGFVTPNIPLIKIIDADQELRRRIEAAQVRDFKWLDTSVKN